MCLKTQGITRQLPQQASTWFLRWPQCQLFPSIFFLCASLPSPSQYFLLFYFPLYLSITLYSISPSLEILLCLRFLTWSLRNLCYDSDHNTPIISSQTNIAYKREKYFLPVWEAGQLVAQHAQSPWVTFNSVGPWHMPVMAVLMRWRQVFLSYMVNSRPAWLLESLSPKKLIQKDMTSPSPPTAQKGNKEFPCSADRPDNGNSPSELGREPGCQQDASGFVT